MIDTKIICNSLSFTDRLPPDEEAFASKACGIHIKFNIEFSNCPKQQKTRPIDKYMINREDPPTPPPPSYHVLRNIWAAPNANREDWSKDEEEDEFVTEKENVYRFFEKSRMLGSEFWQLF